MRAAILLLLVPSWLGAQTTVYLRDHGTGFWADYASEGASNTTPIVIHTAQSHGLAPGDITRLDNFIFDSGSGCGSGGVLQGDFKVKAVIDATHFSITDLNGVDVRAKGTWCDGKNAAWGIPWGGAQWGGKVAPYTLVPGMKGWFDGDAGPLVRQIALGTHNGLTSLTVSGTTATVVTSFSGYVENGSKIAIWNSGSAALDQNHNPYIVTVDSPTQFHFTVSGVPDGTYSGQAANSTCGPSGNSDCLRISTRAFTGNPLWDTIVSEVASNGSIRHIYDGGTTSGSAGPNFGWTGPGEFSAMALKFLVDQKDTVSRDTTLYWINHVERYNGVSFPALETVQDGGIANNIDFVSYYVRDVALMYPVARPYLTADQKAAFIGKMFNDITDPVPCNKVTPVKFGTTATFTSTGTLTGVLTGIGTQWLTDPDPGKRLHAGDAVNDVWPLPSREFYIVSVDSDTSATVRTSNTANITTPFTYWVVRQWTTGDCGLLWFHGHWNGAISHPILYPQWGGYTSNVGAKVRRPTQASNNTFSMHAGYIALSLAAADDDPRAVDRLEKHWSNFFDYYLAVKLHYTTGFDLTGSSYSFARNMNHGPEAAAFMTNSVVGLPDLGLKDYWITRPIYMKIYGVVPDQWQGYYWPARWGTETGANQVDFTSSFGSSYMEDQTFAFNPKSPEAGYWKSWLSSHNWSTVARIFAPRLFISNSDPNIKATDYTTLPTQFLFQATSQGVCNSLGLACPSDVRGDGFISRTGWTNPTDTHLLFEARAFVGEHDLPQGGSLRVYKTGFLLNTGDGIPGAGANSNANSTTVDSLLEFGGTRSLQPGWEYGNGTPAISRIDRWAGGAATGDAASRYAYAEADVSQQYTNKIDRAKMHVVHFKKPGTEEIILKFTDVDVSSSPTQVRGQIHYPQNLEAQQFETPPEGDTSCPGAGGCGNLNATRWIHTQEDGGPGRNASLTTKILSPSAVTVTWDGSSYPGNAGGHDYRVSIYGGAPGAVVSGLEYIEVHKLNGTLDDTSLTASPLNAPFTWTGVQTADKVAAFSRFGRLQLAISMQTTHAGTAQYLIAGLEAGHTYQAYRLDDGNLVASQLVADADNTFYFEGPAGDYRVFPDGLFNLFMGSRPPLRRGRQFQYDFKVAGNSTQYVWSIVGGSLPPGLQLSQNGVLSGMPTQGGDYVVTVRAQSPGQATADQVITLTVSDPALAISVTSAARDRAVVQYGVFGLDALVPCGITLSDQPDFSHTVEAFTDGGGSSVRQAVLGEIAALTPATSYYAQANCGMASSTVSFTTPGDNPAATVIPLSIAPPPPSLHAVDIQVEYGPSKQLGSSITASCGSGCTVPIPALTDQLVYVRRSFLDAGAHVIAQSAIAPLIATR